MNNIVDKIDAINWQDISDNMHDKGYSIVPNFLSETQCRNLIESYDNKEGYRKTVEMARYRFGLGTYKYFNYPLPNIVQTLREALYPRLSPTANLWMKLLNIDRRFPDHFLEFLAECHVHNQQKPTSLILRYGKGGFNTLHQDLYGEIYFPIQAAIILSERDIEYTGGEFVLTQQTPRAQSKAIVLTPARGDMIIFTTNFRPVTGSKGYYRVNMRHGVSELLGGERYALGIIFHDAES